MKQITTLTTLLILLAFISQAQDMSTMKGAAYCAHKKSSLPQFTEQPFNNNSGATHSYDVIKYTLDVNLYNCYSAPYPNSFSGSVIVKFKVDSTLNFIKLHASTFSLIIDSVKLAGISYTHVNNILTVQLNRTYNIGEIADIRIFYRHKDVQDYAFYSTNGTVFTDCEPEGARSWFPCWDKPSDKALLDLTATVKSNVKLGSNGRLADSTLVGDQLTYHWISDQNVATYLIVISSKVDYQLDIIYWHKLSNPADSIPLRFYYNLGEDPTPVMDIMPEMTTWFSQGFVEHPFDKNGFATLNSEFSWAGMENQSLTSLCPGCWGESLAAHEFAHQWFGDMITCATWADIWLNEGFATWSEAYWYESYSGYPAYKADINSDANYYLAANSGWAISNPDWAVSTPSSGILFDYSITYMKGACVVHQLRYVLGDSLFFETLKAYSSDTNLKYKSATIQDFNNTVNQVAGEDYNWFFDAWIYQPNHPVYQNAYDFENLGNNQWKVNFFARQIQTNAPFFKMPLEIYVRFLDGTDTTYRVMNDTNYQHFSWISDQQPVALQFDPGRQIVLKGGSTVVGIDDTMTDQSLVLTQIAPNPATNFTIFAYETREPMNVRVEIINIQGLILFTPVNSMHPAGNHEIKFDCSSLSPGSYVCRITSGNEVQLKKLVITR